MKKSIKNFLVPILTSRPVAALIPSSFYSAIPIFLIHRVTNDKHSGYGATHADHLRRCLDYLYEHNYTALSLEQLVAALRRNDILNPKSVVFTMDDGYVDQAEIASPIFLEYEFPITFFVITGMLDKTIVPWDTQISWIVQNSKPTSLQDYTVLKDIGLELNTAITRRELRRIILSTLKNFRAEEIDLILHKLTIETGLHPTRHTSEQYQPMTWDMARDLERQGVRFAPHSVSHYILSRLSREVMTEEITKSWLSMEKELRSPLKIFCFPNGHAADYGEREITLLKDLGFQGAVTATPAYVDPKMPSMSQIFRLPRLAFPNNMTDFIQLCSWIDRAREKANVDSAEYDV